MKISRFVVPVAAVACLASACGSTSTSSAATSPSATASPVVTASPSATVQPTAVPTLIPTAVPPPIGPTAAQSVAVARAIFPTKQGGYLECDNGASNAAACPLSHRLAAELARYAANYASQCSGGCGGALLFIRDQCGAFPHEAVFNVANPAIALVKLSGDTTCRGVDKTFYVSVVVESGKAVADDVYCGVGDPKYGMYNPDPNATMPVPCPGY